MGDDIAPIDDIRSTAEYRRRVAANLLAEFCRETGVAAPARRR
jgi:xanthine dehydrogenase iron-sulfur cluster and FAD-binding subunit A